MNDAPVYGRLAAMAISAVLAFAAGIWMVWVAFVDRSWAHENGNPIWFAWAGAFLLVAFCFGLVPIVLRSYYQRVVKPMWKGV